MNPESTKPSPAAPLTRINVVGLLAGLAGLATFAVQISPARAGSAPSGPSVSAPVIATAATLTQGVNLDRPRDTAEQALADLEAIDAATRSLRGPAGERIRKLTKRVRARINELAPAPAQAPASASKTATASAGPAQPFSGGRKSTATAGKPMPEKELHDVLRALKNQNLNAPRMGIIQGSIDAGGYFTSAQIARMLHWLTTDDSKVEMASKLWGRCTDPGAFMAAVSRKLDTDAARARLAERTGAKIEGQKPAPAAGTKTGIRRPGTTRIGR